MRYKGQGWEIPVPLTSAQAAAPEAAAILEAFERDYAALFGRTVEGLEAEVTVWSVNARTVVPEGERVGDAPDAGTHEAGTARDAFDPGLGRRVRAAVARRDEMAPGTVLRGPAVVVEAETSVIVPASASVRVLADGTLAMEAVDG
jgi:N-methylhydantoinase A